jgi:hypothetical protein
VRGKGSNFRWRQGLARPPAQLVAGGLQGDAAGVQVGEERGGGH